MAERPEATSAGAREPAEPGGLIVAAADDPERVTRWLGDRGREARAVVALERDGEGGLAEALDAAPGDAHLVVMVARALPGSVRALCAAPLARIGSVELVLLRGMEAGRGQDAWLDCAQRAGLYPHEVDEVVVEGLTGVRVRLLPEPPSVGRALGALAELARHSGSSVRRERPGPRVGVLGAAGEWVRGLAHATVVMPAWAEDPVELRAASADLLLLAPETGPDGSASAATSATAEEPEEGLVAAVDAARAAGAAVLATEGVAPAWQERASALVPLGPRPVDAASIGPAAPAAEAVVPALPEDPGEAASALVARGARGEPLCVPALPEAVAQRLDPAVRALLTRAPEALGEDPLAAWRHGVRVQRAVLGAYDVVAWWRARAGELARPSPAPPTVTVLAVVDDPAEEQRLHERLAGQARRPEELVVVRRGHAARAWPPPRQDEGAVPVVPVTVEQGASLGAALAAGTARASGDLLARLAPAGWLGPHHLGDLVAAHERSGATVVARAEGLCYDPEADATCHAPPTDGAGAGVTDVGLAPETLLVRRDDLAVLGGWAPAVACTNDEVAAHLLAEVARWGGRAYRDHPFGLVRRVPGAAARLTDAGWSAPGLRLDLADCSAAGEGPDG